MLKHRAKKIKTFFINLCLVLLDLLKILFYIVINIIKFKKIYSTNITIVTGADFTHFKSLINLITSVNNYEKNTKLVVYDLGLKEDQVKMLLNTDIDFVYEKFDFINYPSFYKERSKEDNKLGSYAWKSAIVKETIEKYSGSVIWLDAGDKITKNLKLLKIVLTAVGIYIPSSPGKIKDWTHNKTIENFGFDKTLMNKRNLASGMIGFNSENKLTIKIINEWAEKSQNKDLISPKGSSRKNHRQDQSLLTLIAYKYNIVKRIPSSHKLFGIIVHQDPDKVYLSPLKFESLNSQLRSDWYENFNDISTNTLVNASLVWLLDFSSIKKFPKKYFNKLKFVATFSNNDKFANDDLLIKLKDYIEIFFVQNENDFKHLKSLRINNISIIKKENFLESCKDEIIKIIHK
tara:strand:+ start:29553 stop:30764 length:1212 start_codon:yes stop_codon:yes gene_type:complete